MTVIPRLYKDRNFGVEIYGIDPVLHSQATNFGESLHYTKDIASAFLPSYQPDLDGCIPGVDVFEGRIQEGGGRYYWENPVPLEFIVTAFPLNDKGGLARSGTDLVNTKSYYYCDDSTSGIVKVDESSLYLPLEQAQILCGMDTPF